MSSRAAAFQEAMLKGDAALMAGALAPDIRFWSPAVHKPYDGRDSVLVVLRAAHHVLEGLTYTETVESDDRTVLFFTAHVGELSQGDRDAGQRADQGQRQEQAEQRRDRGPGDGAVRSDRAVLLIDPVSKPAEGATPDGRQLLELVLSIDGRVGREGPAGEFQLSVHAVVIGPLRRLT